MKQNEELIAELDALRAIHGESAFERAVQMIRCRKLTLFSRPPRKKFPWAKYRKLYQLQQGMCPYCNTPLFLKKGEVEIDHRDPNRPDFNAETNLQLLHKRCNRKKSARSIPAEAKSHNTTYIHLLTGKGDT